MLHQSEELLASSDFFLVDQPALLILLSDVIGLVIVMCHFLLKGFKHCRLFQLLVHDRNRAEYQLAKRLLILRF